MCLYVVANMCDFGLCLYIRVCVCIRSRTCVCFLLRKCCAVLNMWCGSWHNPAIPRPMYAANACICMSVCALERTFPIISFPYTHIYRKQAGKHRIHTNPYVLNTCESKRQCSYSSNNKNAENSFIFKWKCFQFYLQIFFISNRHVNFFKKWANQIFT